MIIDGRKIAKEILTDLKQKISHLPFVPVFCDVLVGNDPVSAQYVKMKAKAAERVGYKFRSADFPADIFTNDLITNIKTICREPNMCGLIVQLPLPESVDKQAVLDAIDPNLDVDCIGSACGSNFYQGLPSPVFPTAAAVMELLKFTGTELRNKQIVIVGQGELVGKPVKYLLERQGIAPQIIRSKTPNAEEILRSADIIISAAGRPKLITGDKIKSGVIIIDAGTSESDGGIVGDVDQDSVAGQAAMLSPVPGGVGPVTVAMLMSNVYEVAAKRRVISRNNW